MPTISQFYGILIRMFYNDHLPPHFHAEYNEDEVLVSINPISVIRGSVPRRVRSLVFEWAALHQSELMENWNRCRRQEQPNSIEPLD